MQWMRATNDTSWTTAPPPGWYPDPADPSGTRYWDGSQWTEQHSPHTPTTLVAPPPRSSRLVNRRVGWLLVLAGLVGAAVGIWLLIPKDPALGGSVPDNACSTPCAEVLALDEGHHMVFEQIGRSDSHWELIRSTQVPATITPKDVSITSPTGRQLDVSEPTSTETQTITRNGRVYGGVVGFHVQDGGRYRVVVDAPASTHVIVEPDWYESLTRALPVAGCVLILSAALFGSGLVVLIVSRSRRRAATFPQPARFSSAPPEAQQPWLVWIFLGVIVVMIAWVLSVPTVSGVVRTAAAIDPTPDLRVGDCLTALYDKFEYDPPVVDCDTPHRAEVFAKFDLPAVPYPGDDEVPDLAGDACKARFKLFVGRNLHSSDLNQYFVWPRPEWWWKHREVMCVVFDYSDVTGTLKGANR